MSRNARWALVAACWTLAAGIATEAAADATGSVSVSLQVETVSISITGGAVALGGPHGSNVALQAHPQESIREALPPTITNNGNIPITSLTVTYAGTGGQEVSCDAGAGSWAAHATTTASNQFVMRAWASTDAVYTNFNANALAIAPGAGSGNILAAGNSPLAAEEAVPLLLELRTPNPPVAGASGCTVGLTVTASGS